MVPELYSIFALRCSRLHRPCDDAVHTARSDWHETQRCSEWMLIGVYLPISRASKICSCFQPRRIIELIFGDGTHARAVNAVNAVVACLSCNLLPTAQARARVSPPLRIQPVPCERGSIRCEGSALEGQPYPCKLLHATPACKLTARQKKKKKNQRINSRPRANAGAENPVPWRRPLFQTQCFFLSGVRRNTILGNSFDRGRNAVTAQRW
jgi:hypothetical protein